MTRQFSKQKQVVEERKRIVNEFIMPLKTWLETKPEGHTRSSVALSLGLQRNALYKFISGTQTPTIDTIARISLFLKQHGIERGCV
jgi:DNA-binding phage protein